MMDWTGEKTVVVGSYFYLVIHALGLKEPARFKEFKGKIRRISAPSLAERLNELDQRKIIEGKVYPRNSGACGILAYQKGTELHALLGELGEWTKRTPYNNPAQSESHLNPEM